MKTWWQKLKPRYRIKKQQGLISIPLILGLFLIIIAIPITTKLSQQSQDVRNRAAVHMCDAGQRACCNSTQYQVCSADGMNWGPCISCGTGNICTGSGNCGPRPTSVPSCTGTYGCIDPSQCQTTTSGSCDAGLVCCSEREPYPTHFPSPTNTPRPLTPTLTKRPSPTPTCVPVGGSASHVSECCSGRRSDGICVGYSCNGSCKPSGPGEDCRNYNLISGSGSCPDGQMCCKAGPTPTLEPRCATTFDKPTGCYCVLNAHCASNNCAGFVCVSALTPTPIPTSPVSSSCNPLQDTYRCSGNNLQQCTDNVGIGIWTHLDNCCSPSFSGCGCDSTSKRCKPAPTSTPRPGITILPTVIPGGNCTKNAYTTQCIDNGSCAGNGGVCVTVGTGCACHTGVTVTPPREGDCECEGGYYTGATCGILLDKPCGTATPTSTPREGDCECVDGYYEGNTCGTLLDKPCGTATVTPSEGSCVYPKYGVPGNCVMCKTGGPCSSNKECCSGECGVDQRCVPYNPVSTPPNGTTPAVYATPTNVPTQPNPQSECWCEDVCMSDSNCR
ncbi:hypothetical protein KKE45_03490, partial [Patescibacteria group bacterium]|nr:hypothetical protein [Patescibacteria group bacterium]